jgi:hypothetical protein
MNYQQRTAIEHPCRLAIETMHPRFRMKDGITGVVLTVNTGYE